jgi:hypothetical protein
MVHLLHGMAATPPPPFPLYRSVNHNHSPVLADSLQTTGKERRDGGEGQGEEGTWAGRQIHARETPFLETLPLPSSLQASLQVSLPFRCRA